jgi:ATP-dependent Clp protease protease subunit
MKPFWQFRAATKDAGELLLYGPISSTSWWGDEVTPKQFADDLKALGDISELTVYMNSEGGDVFAGQAIYSMLKRHKAHVTVHVDGLAASIASLIAMAGDTVVMPKNAMMMVHNPWTFAYGNSAELRKMADDLDVIRESMLATYTAKTGLSNEEVIALLDAETWLTAEDAVAKGFADEVAAEKQVAASVRDGRLIVNGREVDHRFRQFPADKFAPAVQVPAEAHEDTGAAQARERQDLARRRLSLSLNSIPRRS